MTLIKWILTYAVISGKMRDVRTKINDGEDPELNFLNREYLRNNLQFSVFNLQLFSENQT
jgi:hypothetical protein